MTEKIYVQTLEERLSKDTKVHLEEIVEYRDELLPNMRKADFVRAMISLIHNPKKIYQHMIQLTDYALDTYMSLYLQKEREPDSKQTSMLYYLQDYGYVSYIKGAWIFDHETYNLVEKTIYKNDEGEEYFMLSSLLNIMNYTLSVYGVISEDELYELFKQDFDVSFKEFIALYNKIEKAPLDYHPRTHLFNIKAISKGEKQSIENAHRRYPYQKASSERLEAYKSFGYPKNQYTAQWVYKYLIENEYLEPYRAVNVLKALFNGIASQYDVATIVNDVSWEMNPLRGFEIYEIYYYQIAFYIDLLSYVTPSAYYNGASKLDILLSQEVPILLEDVSNLSVLKECLNHELKGLGFHVVLKNKHLYIVK